MVCQLYLNKTTRKYLNIKKSKKIMDWKCLVIEVRIKKTKETNGSDKYFGLLSILRDSFDSKGQMRSD